MPQWRVAEPGFNVWLMDTPIFYQPTRGPQLAFELFFKNELGGSQTGEASEFLQVSFMHAGCNWFTPWLAYLLPRWDPDVYRFSNGRGSWLSITNSGAPSYVGQMTLTTTPQGVLQVQYPSGTVDSFGVRDSGGRYFRTTRQDPNGNVTTFNYDSSGTALCLTNIVDADGRTTTLISTNIGPYCLLAKVTDPFNRTATLIYDSTVYGCPLLTNITDAAGLTSSFRYGGNNNLTQLKTPYGTTAFTGLIEDDVDGHPIAKALQVHETGANQGTRDQLYLYVDSGDVNKMPTSYAGLKPDTGVFSNTFDATNSHMMNSFYWNPVQYGQLPAAFVQDLTNGTLSVSDLASANYLEARQRHWLLHTNATPATASVGHTISLERAPSPDGTTQGQITWYDYENKYNGEPGNEGTSILPRFIAWKMPNGQSRFVKYVRNSLGHPTQMIETWDWNYSVGNAPLRTNTLTYAGNNIDLLSVSNTLGVLVSSNVYNANSLVTTNYNALKEATLYSYDSSNRLTRIQTPAGLTTTNLYGADGNLYRTIDLEIGRTNTYTWTNQLIYSHIDEGGLARTNTWDALNRLRKVIYPDGTFVTNTYRNLDLILTIDPMGFSNSFEYNDFRKVTRRTDAQNHSSTFQYCECGRLEYSWDALSNRTDFAYDLAGRPLATAYADGYWVSNRFDLLGRITNVVDSAGASSTNWYNNQGLVVAVSNAFGRASARLYDSLDRVTNSIDANGVAVAMTYDALGRVLTRTYPDGGVERFGYGPAGLLAYTNQLSSKTYYGYDAARRKTAETNANQEITRFYYDPSGSLTNLVDGKNQTTTWIYDQYGRVTNKVDNTSSLMFIYGYDANSRLTNRWTPAKGATTFRYDPVGNLTNIVYPTSPSISLQYDALNRVTSMVDGVGNTTYGYDAAGQLLNEDGPWASDTVSYTYNNRLRSGLSVQAPNASAWAESYAYDAAKRLTNVTSLAGAFTYAYDPTRNLQVGQLTLPNGASITNACDSVARLLSTVLKSSAQATINSHSYQLNQANQRTQQVFTAGDYLNYSYDSIGQLKTAFGKEAGGTTNRLHEQLGYTYDAAGNLNFRTNNALVQTFNVNSLNELTTISRSGTFTVAGTTTSAATNVTVNGQTAVRYSDATFAKDGFTLTDGNNTFTAIARDSYGRQDTNVVTSWLPASASYGYDLNGNLLSDGKRGFAYDDENQLIRVTVTNTWKAEFAYDGKMRRRIRTECTWNGTTWVTNQIVLYVYDRNLVIQERDANNLPLVTYTRGKDLSGSLEGAGGIGGLLARTDHSTLNPQMSTAFEDSSPTRTSQQAAHPTASSSPTGRHHAQHLHKTHPCPVASSSLPREYLARKVQDPPVEP